MEIKKINILFVLGLFLTFSFAISIFAGAAENPISIEAGVYPQEGTAPLRVSFNSKAESEEGSIISYKWYFRDDKDYGWHSPVADNTFYVYETPGEYQAKLEVEDTDGNISQQEYTINVKYPKPEIDFSILPDSGLASLDTNFSVTANLYEHPGVEYEIDFTGDGNYNWSSEKYIYCFLTDPDYTIENWYKEGSWGKSESDYKSSPYSWADSPGSDYQADSDYSLVSPEIDLRDYYRPYLEFYHRYELEHNSDFGYLEITTDGGESWNRLTEYTGNQDWEYERVNLNQYSGEIIQIRFRLVSDGSINYSGWKIDNGALNTEQVYTNFTYFIPGIYRPKLKVTDQAGNEYVKEERVVVNRSRDVTAQLLTDMEKGLPPLEVNFNALVNNQEEVEYYEWDFYGNDEVDLTTDSPETSHVFEEPGFYEVRFRGLDDRGLLFEETVEIEVKMEVTLDNLEEYFYPGQGEKAEITYSLTEPAIVDLEIFQRDGTVVKTLLESEKIEAGQNSVQWSGSDVEEGVYFVRLRAITESGREYVVDKTAEELEISSVDIDYPLSFSPLDNQYCDINYVLNEKGLISGYVGRANIVDRTLMIKQPQLTGNKEIIWSGTNDNFQKVDFERDYFVRLFKEEIPENGIILFRDRPEVINQSVKPTSLYLCDDPYLELGKNVEFEIEYDVPVKTEVEIYNQKGKRVRTIEGKDYHQENSLSWGGKDNNGEKLKPGLYTARVTGKSETGKSADEVRLMVRIYH